MKFKLDENFGRSVQRLFHERGHDCLTVRDEGLAGAPDRRIWEAAVLEARILVTMDHEFGNPLLYRLPEISGVAVINPPDRASIRLLRQLVESFLQAWSAERLQGGRLWIIEPGRIRVHEDR